MAEKIKRTIKVLDIDATNKIVKFGANFVGRVPFEWTGGKLPAYHRLYCVLKEYPKIDENGVEQINVMFTSGYSTFNTTNNSEFMIIEKCEEVVNEKNDSKAYQIEGMWLCFQKVKDPSKWSKECSYTCEITSAEAGKGFILKSVPKIKEEKIGLEEI